MDVCVVGQEGVPPMAGDVFFHFEVRLTNREKGTCTVSPSPMDLEKVRAHSGLLIFI